MLYNKLSRTKVLIALVLAFNLTTAALCGGKDESKTRRLAKLSDDFAEGQKSVAKVLANARDNGTISQEDVNEIKPFLQQANDLNAEAIGYVKKLIANPEDVATKNTAVNVINQISAVLVRANQVGLLRIKNENVKAAFSALIITLQAAATSAITILKQ